MGSHTCPGRCGRPVAQHLLACRDCWYRLPVELRRRVTYTWSQRKRDGHAPHLEAVGDAIRFYASETAP